MSKNKIFMAFGKGQETSDSFEVKRYIGVGSVKVVSVNPSKNELEKLYNTEIENEPQYLGNVVNSEGNNVRTARLDFIVKTDTEKSDIDLTTKVTFFLRDEFRYNRDKSKVQIIDKYGRTAWATVEQVKNHEIPIYSNGPANIDKDYRPLYNGEEDLTNFIKTYLNIPNVMKYVNGTWVMNSNPEDSEARLDKIKNYFNGDFSEIKSVISLQPNNKVKVLFGVRSTDDGKQYQTAYTRMFLKNRVTDYASLKKDVEEAQAAGAYSTTEFKVVDLQEYTVDSTKFDSSSNDSYPYAEQAAALPWE